MFTCRIFFFHLYESPRYLVHSRKPQEAVHVLQQIIKINGSTFTIDIEDVRDHIEHPHTVRCSLPNLFFSAWLSTLPKGNSRTSISDPHYSSIDTRGVDSIELPSPTLPRPPVPPHVRTRLPFIPEWIWQPYMSWYDLSVASLSPAWRRTTILMWGAWMSTSAGEHHARYRSHREAAYG